MNVNPHPSGSSSSLKHTSVSPPAFPPPDKRHKLDPIPAELSERSVYEDWPSRLARAGDDESAWESLITRVLIEITSVLATTDQKASFISYQHFDKATEIVKGFSKKELMEWKEGVKNGVNNGKWDLVNHPKLRAEGISPSTSAKSDLSTSGGSREMRGVATINAWKLAYLGEADQVLLHAIDELHKGPRAYAKFLPITQSSGTGKSKTVDEIAKMRIVFPLCIREDLGMDFAYPLPDINVRDYLLRAPAPSVKAPKPSDDNPCKQYLRGFFRSLFRTAFTQAKKLFNVTDGGAKMPFIDMAQLFYTYFSDDANRRQFYDSVVSGAQVDKSEDKFVAQNKFSECFTVFQEFLERNCNDWSYNHCPVIISIDEVHVLFGAQQRDVNDRNHTIFSRLKSVFSELASEPLCVIVLSTLTKITNLAPWRELAPSVRVRGGELSLPDPYTELPFDAYIRADPLVPGKYGLDSVTLFDFCAKFGRPLFYSLYLSRKKMGQNENKIHDDILSMAREKLLGSTWPPRCPAVLNPTTVAVLSARLLLDLSPATNLARQYEVEQVRSHLRMLYSVHSGRQVMVTGSPPEPLVAEAAATIMNYQIYGKPYMDMWRLLLAYIDEGLLGQGAVGELIGRALSISAMDYAIDDLGPEIHLKYQIPVCVTAYYRALLTDEAWETVRKLKPANPRMLGPEESEKTFEEAFASAYVHFSHYGKAKDATVLQDRYAWALWLRGTAVLGQLNQELTDRAIPIYFPQHGKVEPRSMSMIFEQDKAGQSADPTVIATQSTENLGLFSCGNKLPYIAAVHCYALTSDEGIVPQVSHGYNLRKSTTQEAPRYQIDIRGLSAYRAIDLHVSDQIRAMINTSKNFLFDHHPRKYGLDILRTMQALMDGEAETTKWFGGLD